MRPPPVVLALVIGATPALGSTAAVMPLGGADWLLPSAKDALEGDLRSAVAGLGFTVQPLEETIAHINEGEAAGLGCVFTDDDCAVRVGLIADVDVVVTAKVELVDERMVLRGGFLTVDGKSQRHIAGEVKMPAMDMGRSLKGVVARLLTGEGEPSRLPFELTVEPPDARVVVDGAPMSGNPLWLLPGPHILHLDAEHHAPQDRPLAVSPDGQGNALSVALAEAADTTPLYAGVIAAGAGALLAVGAGAAAGLVEGRLEAGLVPHQDRDGWLLWGRIALGTAAAGAAFVGAGAVVALVGAP